MNNKIVMIVAAVVLFLSAIFLIYKVISSASAPNTISLAGIKNDEESVFFNKAKEFTDRGDLLKAKETYEKIIEKFQSSNNISKAQDTLENLNIRILFSPILTKDSFHYEVQKGDNLTKISKKFGVSTELIQKANGLKDANIRIGQRLKISKAKFSIIVDKSQNILTLKSGGEIFKTYRVSTGKNNSTPVGDFKITNKLIDPPWYPPTGGMIPYGDPKNVLGSRWMGISKPTYGIHGTTQPELIGQSVTDGCIRLKNSDVEELYSIVPEGTEVTVVD